MASVVQSTLTAAQLAATLSGVPFAAGSVMALQMITATCSQVAVHKQKAAQLAKRCTSLLNVLNEQVPLLAGNEAVAAFDEAEATLSSVHRRVQKWVTCGKFKRFVKIGQIARDLDRCCSDIDIAMERLHVSNPVALLRMQRHSIDLMQQHQAVVEEKLQQLLISPTEITRAVQQYNSGSLNAAYELMRLGQERLIKLREKSVPEPSASVFSDGRQIDESPDSSRPPSPVMTARNQIEQALLDLHLLTNVPPTIPILNNQVKRISMASVRSGMYSQIYEGRWLGGKKVALKTLRVTPDDKDPRIKRLQVRFEHEITVWSKLKHENVLMMLGVVTNMGPIHIVSPWQLDNVRNYRHDNSDVNPLKLLSQAAKGLEYLHDQQIVHGNLKCTNILVSEEGMIVTLSDFGLTQVLTDVMGRSAMIGLSSTAAVRWQAPELNQGENATPTMASDVFAFGMSALELLTMRSPYAHLRRDISVIKDLSKGLLPHRPGSEAPEAVPWVSDALWEALHRCWKWNPGERMPARELSPCLEEASEWATRSLGIVV